jgi:peptidoglycan/xylan/chitin deacetylase (PgdA/CDA1 family)
MARLFFTWDDGHPDDFILKELHEKYGIPGMLFVPATNREGKPVLSRSDLTRITSDLIEIGSHTYNHVYLTEVSPEAVQMELVDSKKYLEDIVGYELDHFCLPGGRYTKTIIDDALCVYKTVRTANTMCVSHKFPVVDATFHFYPRGWRSVFFNSCKHGSISLAAYAASSCSRIDYFEFIKSCIQRAFEKNRSDAMVIYGHSWEISQCDLWGKLEDLFKYIKGTGITVEKYSAIC